MFYGSNIIHQPCHYLHKLMMGAVSSCTHILYTYHEGQITVFFNVTKTRNNDTVCVNARIHVQILGLDFQTIQIFCQPVQTLHLAAQLVCLMTQTAPLTVQKVCLITYLAHLISKQFIWLGRGSVPLPGSLEGLGVIYTARQKSSRTR